MERRRFLGVTIFGILFTFIGGALCVLVVLFLIDTGFSYYREYNRNPLEPFFHTVVLFVLPLMTFLVGIGVLLLKSWARKIILYVMPPLIFLFLFYVVYSGGRRGYAYVPSFSEIVFTLRFLRTYILFCVCGAVIVSPAVFFFTRPKVKALFSPPKPKT